jgi:hypothetical protein
LLMPFQDAAMFIASMQAMHIGIVSQAVNASQVCIPSKTYNIMAFNKPIICIGEADTDLGQLIETYQLGKTFTAKEPALIAGFIRQMAADKNLYKNYCENVAKSAPLFTKANVNKILDRIQQTTTKEAWQ